MRVRQRNEKNGVVLSRSRVPSPLSDMDADPSPLSDVQQAIADKEAISLNRMNARMEMVLNMAKKPRPVESIESLLAKARLSKAQPSITQSRKIRLTADLLTSIKPRHYTNDQLDNLDLVAKQHKQGADLQVSLSSDASTTQADSKDMFTHLRTKVASFAFWAFDKGITLFSPTDLWQSGVPSLFENQLPKQVEFPKKMRF